MAFVHYAWRLLAAALRRAQESLRPARAHAMARELRERFAHLGDLRAAEREVLTSAPHASHHIYTNLPDPGDGAFEDTSCVDRYRKLAHRPDPGSGEHPASRVFEHVLAQLLFESSYEPASGTCREYHVHFGAPTDACAQLAAAPERFLAATGALGSVRAALERGRVGAELDRLAAAETDGASTGSTRADAQHRRQRQLEPPAYVSFQCYIEGADVGHSSYTVSLAGDAFSAEETRVAPSVPNDTLLVDRYAMVATMLVRGFHYGGLLSEAGGAQIDGEDAIAASFGGQDFMLAHAAELGSVDIYLASNWIADRRDLLEIYPYELHLRNFVRMFRRQYARERGRL
jgi:hypothetical protein